MDKIERMDQTWIPLIASIVIPLSGIIINFRNSRQDPGAVRKMRRHAQLLEMLPDAAKPSLQSLLVSEVNQYATRQGRKYKRKLDGGVVAAVIIAGLVFGVILYPLFLWAVSWPYAWYAFGFVAVFAILFMGVGTGQIFKPIDPEQDEPSP